MNKGERWRKNLEQRWVDLRYEARRIAAHPKAHLYDRAMLHVQAEKMTTEELLGRIAMEKLR